MHLKNKVLKCNDFIVVKKEDEQLRSISKLGKYGERHWKKAVQNIKVKMLIQWKMSLI